MTYDRAFAEEIGATAYDTKNEVYLKEGCYWDGYWLYDSYEWDKHCIPISQWPEPEDGVEYIVHWDDEFTVMVYNKPLNSFYDMDVNLKASKVEYWPLPEKGTGRKVK